jgi:hypothetical protein
MRYNKTSRTMPRKPSPLAEPILIATWRKNRGAAAIRVTLKNYEGQPVVDVRTFMNPPEGGPPQPAHGFTCGVRHLRTLNKAIYAALRRAAELGLLDEESPLL